MTSKFTPIVKIKKQQMDMIETHLAKARQKNNQLKRRLDNLREEISSQIAPKEGNIQLYNVYRENLSILRKEMSEVEKAYEISNQEVAQLQQKYKNALREFEKMKYLEGRDFEEFMKKLKRQEQLDMDEVSMMLFANRS